MPGYLASQVLQRIKEARELYNRLILIVGPAGSGKTRALQDVSLLTSTPIINVNLELSAQMLGLTKAQRALQLPCILSELVDQVSNDLVLLDNTELLFDIQLKHDPLRLLQRLSRNKTILASWNGAIENDHLVYAVPEHPEYRRYLMRDFLVVNCDIKTSKEKQK